MFFAVHHFCCILQQVCTCIIYMYLYTPKYLYYCFTRKKTDKDQCAFTLLQKIQCMDNICKNNPTNAVSTSHNDKGIVAAENQF